MTRPDRGHAVPPVAALRQAHQVRRRLAKTLIPQQKTSLPTVGIRQGVVTAVSLSSMATPPTYTVTVGGVAVKASCIGTCGPLTGDTVMILRQGPDWMILGLAQASVVARFFTPTWLAGTTALPLSQANGYYRMIAPTTMWWSILMVATNTGASGQAYSIGGLPLAAVVAQSGSFVFNSRGGTAQRYGVVGYIDPATNARQFLRLAGPSGGTGIHSGSPDASAAQPISLQGSGLLEVDPSGA